MLLRSSAREPTTGSIADSPSFPSSLWKPHCVCNEATLPLWFSQMPKHSTGPATCRTPPTESLGSGITIDVVETMLQSESLAAQSYFLPFSFQTYQTCIMVRGIFPSDSCSFSFTLYPHFSPPKSLTYLMS